MQWQLYDPAFEADSLNSNLPFSPWGGHRNFAYDLVVALQPKRIVELGSHYGCSLFAFAQAIKDKGLPTELFGIDTWQGDEQAGFYSNEVFELVQKTISEHFSRIPITLLRKTFLEARADIEDQSVDVLHIDGLHTYEAVVEDFDTWLCKLAPEGVVLFHDVNPKLTYGSRQHWEEVSARFPSLRFDHSWGLGVLFPKGDSKKVLVAGEFWEERRLVYQYRAEGRLASQQVRDLSRFIDEQKVAMDKMESMIRDRDEAIAAQTKLIDERDAYIKVLETKVSK
jgi:predicted O-methyltransferase YrrM